MKLIREGMSRNRISCGENEREYVKTVCYERNNDVGRIGRSCHEFESRWKEMEDDRIKDGLRVI